MLRLAVATGLVFLLVGWFAVQEFAEQSRGSPCPDLPHTLPPVQIRLAPGLEDHQSWVAFPPLPDGRGELVFAFCRDGRLVSIIPRSWDDSTRTVTFSVRTRWTNLQWLANRLGDYQNPAHWELRYVWCDDEPEACE